MTWYTAHVIMWMRFKDGRQDCFPVEENLVLICAESPDIALKKAAEIAKADYAGDDNSSLRYDKRPCDRVFGGIRRLIECVDSSDQPADGTEVTYQFLKVDSQEQLDALVASRDVVVTVHGEDQPDSGREK
jgi:hypothetical protein